MTDNRHPGQLPLDLIWCLTCQHEHIARIPSTTWACAGGPEKGCGFGSWDDKVAIDHAAGYPEHVVYSLHHSTVPLPPARPEIGEDEDGYPLPPDGWTFAVMGPRPGDPDHHRVLCGWRETGEFVQYATTEQIVTAAVKIIQETRQ